MTANNLAACVWSTNNAPALFNMGHLYTGDEISEWHVMNGF